jgi:hypothetical protein
MQRLRRTHNEKRPLSHLEKLSRWLDANILDLGRQMRVAYLPPLMVYMAAGISGLTSIVGTFFVKDYLRLVMAGLPWFLDGGTLLGHVHGLIVGLVVAGLAFPRGPKTEQYGHWDTYVV